MGKKTKIDWCDSTWNPVTGCLHGCEYCYARRIANRFGGASETHNNECGHECQWITEGTGEIHELGEPIYDFDYRRNAPYPFDFDPTFHRYKLDEPQHWKKPRTIFVCSMADLFGEWVPDAWIAAVFEVCKATPQHRYLFLTKNAKRYVDLAKKGIMPDTDHIWYGCSVTRPEEPFFFSDKYKTFVSIEPILGHFDLESEMSYIEWPEWVITGAETGNRKNKVKPEKDWLSGIVNGCAEHHIPLFMKESLRALMGEDFRQEFPWEEE